MQTGYITQWKLGGMVALIAPDGPPISSDLGTGVRSAWG